MQQNQQLLGLLSEVEMLKAEIAKMRGQAEVQLHQLDTLASGRMTCMPISTSASRISPRWASPRR